MSGFKERKFPLIKVHGSNYEMGLQYGEKCSDLIKEHVKTVFEGVQKRGVQKKTAFEYAKRSINFGAKYAPHLVEELNGIAEGAGVHKQEIYFLNSQFPSETDGCTIFVVFGDRTADGSTILVQNVDLFLESRAVERGIVLQMTPKKGPSMLMFCKAGQLFPQGINSEGGLRLGNEMKSIFDKEFGTPDEFIARRFIEQTTIEDALNVVKTADRAVSNATVARDRSGRVVHIEWCPKAIALLEPYMNVPSKSYFFHTNHFLHPDMLKYEFKFGNRAKSTITRLERIRELLSEWDKTNDKLSIDTVKEFISDHANKPYSICSHPALPDKKSHTVASIIAQPEKKTLHVCKGNPCEDNWNTYRLP